MRKVFQGDAGCTSVTRNEEAEQSCHFIACRPPRTSRAFLVLLGGGSFKGLTHQAERTGVMRTSILITDYRRGQCMLSGKETGCVLVEFMDGSLKGTVSLKCLEKLLRSQVAERDKAGTGSQSASTPQ